MCENIFSERIIRVWNSRPPSIVSFKSLFSFRNSLGNVNLGLYTKYWSLFLNLFLLSMYLVLAYVWFCVFYCYMHVFADYVACKWRHSPFATLIVNK